MLDYTIKKIKGLPLGQFDILEKTGLVQHAFTTKHDADGKTFDLNPKADKQNFQKNIRLLAESLDFPVEGFTLSDQTHDLNVLPITWEDRGKGVVKPRNYKNIDALITDEKNIMLTTFFADCIPLYILDTLTPAIGMAHSGWKGTVGQIGVLTLKAMSKHYGTRAKNCMVAIGPGIGPHAFESGVDVAEKIFALSPTNVKSLNKGKFLADLWKINRDIMYRNGVPEKNIVMAEHCTYMCKDSYFSYRREEGQTGRMAACMALID